MYRRGWVWGQELVRESNLVALWILRWLNKEKFPYHFLLTPTRKGVDKWFVNIRGLSIVPIVNFYWSSLHWLVCTLTQTSWSVTGFFNLVTRFDANYCQYFIQNLNCMTCFSPLWDTSSCQGCWLEIIDTDREARICLMSIVEVFVC